MNLLYTVNLSLTIPSFSLSLSLQLPVMTVKMVTFPPLTFSALLAINSSRLQMRELIDHIFT